MNQNYFELGYSFGNLDAHIKTSGVSYLHLDIQEAEPYAYNLVERILYKRGYKADDFRVVELLLNQKKAKDINKELGYLFGYSKKNIEKIID